MQRLQAYIACPVSAGTFERLRSPPMLIAEIASAMRTGFQFVA